MALGMEKERSEKGEGEEREGVGREVGIGNEKGINGRIGNGWKGWKVWEARKG